MKHTRTNTEKWLRAQALQSDRSGFISHLCDLLPVILGKLLISKPQLPHNDDTTIPPPGDAVLIE